MCGSCAQTRPCWQTFWRATVALCYVAGMVSIKEDPWIKQKHVSFPRNLVSHGFGWVLKSRGGGEP